MSANLIVGKDPSGNKVPIAVDAAGKIQIGGVQLDNLNVNTDQIEAKQDVTNALLTTQAADTASIKTQLATGSIAVTGGGGGSGGASAAYNATLPTYTSGASSTLQTDINGKLITTGTLTDTQLRASALPVSLASVPSHPVTNAGTFAVQPSAGDLTSGSQTTKIVNGANTLAVDSSGAVTANTPASVVYNYTATGVIALNTVVLGPITGDSIKEISVQVTSLGTSFNGIAQISNDNATWITATYWKDSSGQSSTSTTINSLGFYTFPTNSVKYFRVICSQASTALTTTLVAYTSQTSSSKGIIGAVLTSNQPSPLPSAGLGFALYHNNNSSASVNGTLVKGTSGTIGTLLLTNTTASFKYLLLVNKSTTAPVSGTDSPILSIPIPPNSTIDCSTSFAGVKLGNGIGYYISATNTFTGVSTSSTPTAVAAGDVNVAMSYV